MLTMDSQVGLSQLLYLPDQSLTGSNGNTYTHCGGIPACVTLLSPRLDADGDIIPGQHCDLTCTQTVDTEQSSNKTIHDMFECDPVLNYDNTEIKTGYTSNEPNNEPRVEPEVGIPNTSDIVNEDAFLNVYTTLISWCRDLPEGMFISRLLRDIESENTLEETRQLFFDALKPFDDFPFGLQSELKRIVGTRKMRLNVKISADIYRLLSVM